MTTPFLLFTLAAPIASFGDLAGHERRGSRDRPGRSAILGLLGAALGIRRDDVEGQNALFNGYETGVRVDNPGQPFQDFHTAQAVPGSRIRQPQTRKRALEALNRSDNAELTRRDYRTDSRYVVAVEALADARWSLTELSEALLKPVFALWLGRKSCPLSLPLDPRIFEALDMLAALECGPPAATTQREEFVHRYSSRSIATPYVAVSAAARRPADNRPTRIERANDRPLDRIRWHFAERHEAVYRLLPKREEQP